MQNGSKTSQRKTNRLQFPPSGALLHFKIIKILVGNRKPLDFSISVRSASNVASVRIYNVMRSIKVHLTPKIFFAKIIRLILWSNLVQEIFDLVESSNFYGPSKPGFRWFTTVDGESGES